MTFIIYDIKLHRDHFKMWHLFFIYLIIVVEHLNFLT